MKSPSSPVADTVGSVVAHTDGVPAGRFPAGAPEPLWRPVESVPWGVPVRVRDAGAQSSAIAIRHAAAPEWFNESRSASIGFTPAEWSPVG